MTICFLSKRFHPIIGGAENQALELGSWLRAHGIGVLVLTLQLQPDWPREEAIAGLMVRRLPLWAWLPALANQLWIERRQIEVALSFGAAAAFNAAGGLLCRWLSIPVVARLETEGDVANLGRRRCGALRMAELRRHAAFVSFNERMREELLAASVAPGKLHVIPNGVDTNRFCSAPPEAQPPRPFTVLYTGRLVARKGVEVLLNAWELVLDRQPEARLLIAGTGGNEPDSVEPELRARAAWPEFRGSVSFLGPVKQVEQLLPHTDVFVLPSRREGQPRAVLEAMACARPIVATRISGITELIADRTTGLLVAPDKPEELAKAVLELMDNKALAARLGRAAREFVLADHSLDSMGQRYLELFDTARRMPRP